MELKHVALVIADIGGYTRFIRAHKTALLHAQEIIAQLLEAIIERAAYPLTLTRQHRHRGVFAPISRCCAANDVAGENFSRRRWSQFATTSSRTVRIPDQGDRCFRANVTEDSGAT